MLSADEIAELARGGDSLPGLTARWPFDRSDENTAGDTQILLTGPVTYAAGRFGEALQLDRDFNQPKQEPGVRFRLYWVGQPLAERARLMADQSPNIDLTIAYCSTIASANAFPICAMILALPK